MILTAKHINNLREELDQLLEAVDIYADSMDELWYWQRWNDQDDRVREWLRSHCKSCDVHVTEKWVSTDELLN